MGGVPVQEHVRARPSPLLAPFLTGYTGYRTSGAAPAIHRGLPSPGLTVILTLDDPLHVAAHPDPAQPTGSYDALVGGLHTVPALIRHDGRQSGVQLHLSPLGARALLGVPAGELSGLDVDASDVWGTATAQVHDRIRGAGSWAARFAVLDDVLGALVRPERRPPADVVHVWYRMLASGGRAPVAGLAAETGWSGRWLARRFQEEIGLAPKVAARVIRFDAARRMVGARAGTLADVAAACGYYDQAHLARDFVDLAGCPPSRWLAEEFRNVQAGTDDGTAGSWS